MDIYIFMSWLNSCCFILKWFCLKWIEVNHQKHLSNLLHKSFFSTQAGYEWISLSLIQVALTCTQIWWTSDVGMAFARLEEGYDNAMKEYYKKQVFQLNTLISMLVGQLTPGDRQKVMTICTIDVHARDVVAKMIAQKVRKWVGVAWWTSLAKNLHCINSYADSAIAAIIVERLLPVSNALKIFK